MLHVKLDALIGGRAVAHSVTVLILLGLWLFALWAVGCEGEGGDLVNDYTRQGAQRY